MNRLERLREVPDAAWTEAPEPGPHGPRRAPSPVLSPILLPWRVLRAAVRDPGRAWLMYRMALAYVAVSALARLLPLPRAFALVSPRLGFSRPDEESVGRVVNALDTLLAAQIPFIQPQCWRRAAVLHRFLRLAGVDTTIVFGVRTDGAQAVEAHAWIERGGQPFAEAAQTTSFRRVFEFPDLRPIS